MWRFGMTKRRTDWGSLIAGLVFLGLAIAFIVRGSGSWEFRSLWAVPVLVSAGRRIGVPRAGDRRHRPGRRESGGQCPVGRARSGGRPWTRRRGPGLVAQGQPRDGPVGERLRLGRGALLASFSWAVLGD